MQLRGPAGLIDCAVDTPGGALAGIAVIGHPHPLFGGTRDNKVVQTVMRTLLALGYQCWRPNFRGVGRSEGVHDDGRGETDDFLVVIDEARRQHPEAPVVLSGFSFGTYVATQAAQRLGWNTVNEGTSPLRKMILIGAATSRWALPPTHPASLLIHGEQDETVPLATVLAWAQPQQVPVSVIAGADHFFHRRLGVIRNLIVQAFGREDLFRPVQSQASESELSSGAA